VAFAVMVRPALAVRALPPGVLIRARNRWSGGGAHAARVSGWAGV